MLNEKITQELMDSLTVQAKGSERLRMNLDLRDSSEDPQAPVLEWEVSGDGSQRMLNAIEPGSPMPIHRHRHSSETVVCLRGRLVWEYYDEAPKPSGNEQPEEELERICTETIELSPNGPVVALNVPAGQCTRSGRWKAAP